MPKLRRVRACDGQCCKESPRFPTADRSSCLYLENGRCLIQAGKAEVPENYEDWFINTCLRWPHFWRAGRDTGGCCWQWVDGN
jgi:hypothetical protein